jgi:glutaryl-CoA dehydrogenase
VTEFYPSDLYGFSTLLSSAELDKLAALRRVLDETVRPLLADNWERGTFPSEVVKPLIDLELMALPDGLYSGFRNFELARTDASIATFYNAQSGLFRATIARGGSAEQLARWEPLVTSWRFTGVVALTEPDHGSDIAGGLATRAVRTPGSGVWVLDGEKRWVGGASSAQYLAVFARDEDDGQVKAFLVPSDAKGVTMTTIAGKTSLRIMQNSDITLRGVRVSEEFRLKNVNGFSDVAGLLRSMRSDVAWIATGVGAGAYEAALRYVLARQQFGRPVAGFQLIQEKLALMLANVTASLAVVTRLSQQQEEGVYADENSALAKMFCALRTRETVAMAREVVGGNGILLDRDVARFHADAEAVYSYEGTHQINALVVGRAITGLSAFAR